MKHTTVHKMMLIVVSMAAVQLMISDRVHAQQSEEALYRAVEPRIKTAYEAAKQSDGPRKLYDKHLADFKAGISKRTGPSGNWFDHLSFDDWSKMYYYNQASMAVTCAIDVGLSDEDLSKGQGDTYRGKFLPCFSRRLQQMSKFFELDNLFFTFSIDKFESECEPKARLTNRERSLPPYTFLQPSKNVSLRLMQFNVYLKCYADISGMAFDPALLD